MSNQASNGFTKSDQQKLIGVLWLSVFTLSFAVAVAFNDRKAEPMPFCYDTGDYRKIAVYPDSGASYQEIQYRVHCADGSDYWQ